MEAWVRSVARSESHAHSSESTSLALDKGLMVDVCLLEDALRNSLSSSKETGLKRVSDRIDFSFSFKLSSSTDESFKPSSLSESSFLSPHEVPSSSSLLERISEMGSVFSSSSVPLPPVTIPLVDWSLGPPQHLLSLYSKGQGINQISYPFFLSYSPTSKLFYVADFDNHRIQVFRNNPRAEKVGRLEVEFLPPFGSDVARFPALQSPTNVLCHEGFLFITDLGNNRVLVCRETDGSVVRSIGAGKGSAVGQFSDPRGCTVDGSHLFVSDQGNNRIQKFSLPYLTDVQTFGSSGSKVGELSSPCDLVVFQSKLYVADNLNNRISVFDPDTGRGLYVIGPKLSNREILFSPRGLLVSNNLFFISSYHRISVFNVYSQYLYSFGSEGFWEGQFSNPGGMLMIDERLFVCEGSNNRIQVFEKK